MTNCLRELVESSILVANLIEIGFQIVRKSASDYNTGHAYTVEAAAYLCPFANIKAMSAALISAEEAVGLSPPPLLITDRIYETYQITPVLLPSFFNVIKG